MAAVTCWMGMRMAKKNRNRRESIHAKAQAIRKKNIIPRWIFLSLHIGKWKSGFTSTVEKNGARLFAYSTSQ